MFGAELIDKDLNVKANSPEMIKGLTVMAQLYKEGRIADQLCIAHDRRGDRRDAIGAGRHGDRSVRTLHGP